MASKFPSENHQFGHLKVVKPSKPRVWQIREMWVINNIKKVGKT